MIPARFEYHRPASLQDAVALLAQLGEEARPLAGGHSLSLDAEYLLAGPEGQRAKSVGGGVGIAFFYGDVVGRDAKLRGDDLDTTPREKIALGLAVCGYIVALAMQIATMVESIRKEDLTPRC